MVGHEAVAKEAERVAVLSAGECQEERFAVGVVGEDLTAIEGVIHQALIDGPG
jgi:hypothetical protein